MGRWISRAERAARDKKIIELYQQGVTPANLRLRFAGVDVFRLLRREGIEANQRGKSIYSGLRHLLAGTKGV